MTSASELPVPSPDREFYARVTEAGFARFPARAENWRRYKAAVRGETCDYLPVRIDIENVSRCNYRCTMCQVSDWPKMTRGRDMEVAEFTALLDQQTGLVEIKLQGMGEPLLAADSYFAMIREARGRDIWVRSTTNGSLLHLKENYKRLIDSDICEVQVSIDGASEESYQAIRRGGQLGRVKANATLLNRYAVDSGRHRTRMWVVAQKANHHELELFPALAAELGFQRLSITMDLNKWGQDRWETINEQANVLPELDVERARGVLEIGRALGVEVTFWVIDNKFDIADRAKLCHWLFERVYVSSDMRVVPCCMVGNPDIFELGDAHDLSAVWNGERMRAFRREHLEGRIPDFCRFCYKD